MPVLASATQLQSLAMDSCWLTDDKVSRILRGMVGLQSLQLCMNFELTRSSAPSIASLTKLTHLNPETSPGLMDHLYDYDYEAVDNAMNCENEYNVWHVFQSWYRQDSLEDSWYRRRHDSTQEKAPKSLESLQGALCCFCACTYATLCESGSSTVSLC